MDKKQTDYPRPSVAVDSVVFGLESVPPEQRSKLDTKKLKILLVRRGNEPHKGMFALPGGFLKQDEEVEQALSREIAEETGITDELKTINLGIYSKKGRDSRGWIISCAFLALTNKVEICSSEQSDAAEARWFDFDFAENKNSAVILLGDGTESIRLDYSDGKYVGEQLIAFDHAQIIYDGFIKLREEVVIHDLIFPLLPPLFTIADLQQPYELITGKQTSPANFRRKMLNKITETNETAAAISHRPAKLYRVRTDDNIMEE
ncbi:MAG: NUDIX hydrolase [Ruminococcus sp.]|nr:NUDIX hydrolase [Ruminococcus sp.]